MTTQHSEATQTDEVIGFSSNYFQKADHRERRRLEMKRRLGELHYKRDRLEHELSAIKNALLTLDSQMQRYAAYEQLSR